MDYTYRATGILKVTDGDTFWLYLDVGFYTSHLTNIRLLGYDCPETNRGTAFEKEQAVRARTFTADFLETGLALESLFVKTKKDPDSFGRWLGEVWIENEDMYNGKNILGHELVATNLATVWPTRWREVFSG